MSEAPDTIKLRFSFAEQAIKEQLSQLEYIASDNYKLLGPNFKENIDEMTKRLEEMAMIVSLLRTTNV